MPRGGRWRSWIVEGGACSGVVDDGEGVVVEASIGDATVIVGEGIEGSPEQADSVSTATQTASRDREITER